jgi:DNA-directed RNA polymerase subunit omega
MLDELKEEEIVNKVGGRFKLSTLIQKRLVQLNRGARPLVDVVGKPGMDTVILEIMQDKIYLDQSENVIMAIDDVPDVDGDRDGGPSLADI